MRGSWLAARLAVVVALIGLLCTVLLAPPQAHGVLPAVYSNPVSQGVTDTFADPAVIRAKDGFWYAYGTTDAIRQSAGDEDLHLLPVLRSRDLTEWQYVGDVFAPSLRPSWHPRDSLLWAADIRFLDGRYVLYYSLAVSLRGERSSFAVGVATAPAPTGPWRDRGRVLHDQSCPTDADIDPAEFDDLGGTRYLYWGSFEHLCVAELDQRATRAVGAATAVYTGFAEGAYVIRRGGFIYLFVSEGTCCDGEFSGYQVKVGRSRDPRGPFLDPEGNPLTATHTKGGFVAAANGNRWVGPGHISVATDLAGQDWLVYHAVDRFEPRLRAPSNAPRRPLLLDRLDWVSGWPTLRAGAGPADQIEVGPASGWPLGGDFNDGPDIDPRWRPDGEIAAGWAIASDRAAGAYATQTTTGPAAYLVSALPTPPDVRAEADLRVHTPGSPGAVGLVAAYRGPRDHVIAWLDARKHALVTDVLVDGRSGGQVVTPLGPRIRLDRWHNVAVELRGRRLHVDVTEARLGDPIATQTRELPTDSGVPTVGTIGVAVAGGRGDADNISVSPLYEPVTQTVPPPDVTDAMIADDDHFDRGKVPGTGGDPRPWQWIRGPRGSVGAGGFTWPTDGGELYGPAGTAGVLVRPAPPGNYTIETKLTFEGDGTPFQQAGLILYADDDRYIKLVHVLTRGSETARTELAKEDVRADRTIGYGGNFIGPPARTMWLRIAHNIDLLTGEHVVRGATSVDGKTWIWGATWTLPAGTPPRVGLIAANTPGAVATFHYFRIYR